MEKSGVFLSQLAWASEESSYLKSAIYRCDGKMIDTKAEIEGYVGRFPDEAANLLPLTKQLAQEPARILSRHNMRGHITSSVLVLSTDLESVLLIAHINEGQWLQPGGHYEGTGSLEDSALREVKEETGLSTVCLVPVWDNCEDKLFDVDTHVVAERPSRGESKHLHHDFMYLGVDDEFSELKPNLSEVKNAMWFPIAKINQLPNPRFVRIHNKLASLNLLERIREQS